MSTSNTGTKKWLLLGLHWLIIGNFLVEIIYAAYMVFFVVAPEGGGALFDQALEFPFEQMVTRRLYALEFWLATLGLSLYLALTEIGPRLRELRSSKTNP